MRRVMHFAAVVAMGAALLGGCGGDRDQSNPNSTEGFPDQSGAIRNQNREGDLRPLGGPIYSGNSGKRVNAAPGATSDEKNLTPERTGESGRPDLDRGEPK
jgi:hypothetical protein